MELLGLSRTVRKIPLLVYWNPWGREFYKWTAWGYHRAPKTQNTKINESRAEQALRDEGFIVPPRLASRANPTGVIPDAWDDLVRSAYKEIDYNDGMIFKVEDVEWP